MIGEELRLSERARPAQLGGTAPRRRQARGADRDPDQARHADRRGVEDAARPSRARGEELVAPLRVWLGEWADAVGEHHERWDGPGYPRGLAGDEIALAARIVAVADVFDVITSARSYKPPFAARRPRGTRSPAAPGTQFDPRVVRAFLNISLGRLRLVMGPLSWLAHAPLLARMPLTPAIGTPSASMATVAAAVAAGILATSPSPGAASLARPLGHAAAPTAQAPANRSPVARDDKGSTEHALPVTVAVLANDTDPDGDALSVVSVSIIDAGSPRTQILRRIVRPVEPNARAGRVQIAGRRVRLTPSAAFTGTVTVRYAVSDGRGGRATALVTIDVAGPATRPAAASEQSQARTADAGSDPQLPHRNRHPSLLRHPSTTHPRRLRSRATSRPPSPGTPRRPPLLPRRSRRPAMTHQPLHLRRTPPTQHLPSAPAPTRRCPRLADCSRLGARHLTRGGSRERPACLLRRDVRQRGSVRRPARDRLERHPHVPACRQCAWSRDRHGSRTRRRRHGTMAAATRARRTRSRSQ